MGYAPTVKAATAAAAAVLAAAGVRFVAPAAAALVADGLLPRAQAAAATWLTPPYLYLVINAIIISIAASSRFQLSSRPSSAPHYDTVGVELEPEHVAVEPAAPMQVPAPVVAPPLLAVRAAEAVLVEEPVVKVNTAAPAPAPEEGEEEEFSISRSTWTPRRRGAEADAENEVAPFADLTNSREKPLVSARFGRKATKPSPEGSRALRVARPRKEETLESTWNHGGAGAPAAAAPEEVRHLGDSPRAPPLRRRRRQRRGRAPRPRGGDAEGGDVQRRAEQGAGACAAGAVAGAGRAEPAGGGVHQQVQHGDAAAAAGVAQALPRHAQQGQPLLKIVAACKECSLFLLRIRSRFWLWFLFFVRYGFVK